jgi:hypothetical protein
MPNYSGYGDAWHSNLEVQLAGRRTGEGTRRAPASIEPGRQEEVMYHTNPAASAAPEPVYGVAAVFLFEPGWAWEASAGGRSYICPHRPHARRFLRYYR